MIDSENVVTPLFANDEPGPYCTVGEAVERIREPGQDAGVLATQYRGFVQRRLVQARAKRGTGRTAHNLFAPADLAAAKVLSVLTELGLADNEVMQSASLGLYAWGKDDPHRTAGHPITAALAGISKGEWWIFKLAVFRSSETGNRRLTIDIYSDSAPPPRADLDTDMVPRTTIEIPLAPLLQKLVGLK